MENKIGTTFTHSKTTYRTVADTTGQGCTECFFACISKATLKPEKAGECIGEYRKDGKGVHFEKVEPEKRKGRIKVVHLP